MNESDDPISTAIGLLVTHAPAAPQKMIDECAERVLTAVPSVLNGGNSVAQKPSASEPASPVTARQTLRHK